MTRFRGFQKYAYKRQKPGYYLHDFLNSKNPLELFGNKKFVVSIVALAIIIGGAFLFQGPIFHSRTENVNCIPSQEEITLHLPCGDPFQQLFATNNFPNSGFSWSTLNSNYVSNCNTSSFNCMRLSSSSTQPALALSKIPIAFDTIGKHELYTGFDYCFHNNPEPSNVQNRWGVYFTTNGTIPSGSGANGYNPKNDPSVSFALEVSDTGSGTVTAYQFIQRDQTQTISSEDTSFGTQGDGSIFLALNGNQNTNSPCTLLRETNIATILNYTGASPSTSGTQSEIDITPQSGTSSQTFQTLFPWFSFQSVQYHIGFYMLSCAGCVSIDMIDMQTARMDPPLPLNPPTAVIIPPAVDIGGFFGPIIRALISIGVFILANIIAFGNYLVGLMGPVWTFLGGLAATILNGLSSIIITLLNLLGSLIGDPNLGDQLVSIFTQIGSYISSLFTRINTLVSNLITFILDSFNFLFDATNGFLTYWIGTVLFGILGVLVTISNIIVTVLRVFQVAFPFVVLADLLWLLSESIDNGSEGAMKWWAPHEILVVNVGKLMFILVETLSTFVYQTIMEIEGGAADIKPEIAGFSP